MTLVQRVIVTIVIGVLLYLVDRYLPMDAEIKKWVRIIVLAALIVWWLIYGLALAGINI